MRHFTIIFQPDGKRISIHEGATILEAAHQAQIILNTTCGGKGTCGKCAVRLEPTGREVLACQHKISSDLTVTVPKTSRFYEQKILEHGITRAVDIHPTVKKLCVSFDSAGFSRIEQLLDQAGASGTYHLTTRLKMELGQLSYIEAARPMTFVCHHEPSQLKNCQLSETEKCIYHVVAYELGDTRRELYGVAVDIGTTTVVAKLLDLTDGELVATASDLNPQARYGNDVISRISYVETESERIELQHIIIDCLNKLIGQLTGKAGIDKNNIYELTAVGNTTMNHLFLHLPVEQLGQAPYLAHSLEAYDIPAARLNIDINPAGNIHTVENIAGFVGSDTTAAALAVGMDLVEQMTLLVDIGTNGELVLGTKDKLYSASCAAGPALEGAQIEQGSRAVSGAIEAVVINKNDIDIDVIGDCPAASICGSGLIDAVAIMLELGVIDSTGRFVEPEKLQTQLPRAILNRIISRNSQPAFILAYAADKPSVVLTQKDVREVQLAKAAIRAGIKLLQNKLKLADEDLSQVMLAGAFGNYIRKSSALRIGLLPNVLPERIHFVGNAAGAGAGIILLSRKAHTIAADLAGRIEYVEIAHDHAFSDVYADSMLF